MMLYPPMADLVEKVGSRYRLVNIIAKRAREIADFSEEHGYALVQKPVSTVIDEIYSGKIKYISKEKEN